MDMLMALMLWRDGTIIMRMFTEHCRCERFAEQCSVNITDGIRGSKLMHSYWTFFMHGLFWKLAFLLHSCGLLGLSVDSFV
jgi:hypothetical protein